MVVVPSPPPPPKEPYVIEDGGLYIMPIAWLNRAQPTLEAGHAATGPGVYDFGGHAKLGLGGEIGIPAGRANTLKLSYFRIQGNSAQTLTNPTTLFSQAYLAGDFVSATVKIQNIKLSWDYLSYTWHKPKTAIHLKTLYEVQYVNTAINTAAPLLPVTSDASGNVNDNTASGTKSIVLPTFGMAMGSQLNKWFRWDIRGSGFGFPHHSVIGDVSATMALRLGKVELVAGERLYYFRTSSKADLYVKDTLQGVYGGLRFAWMGKQ